LNQAPKLRQANSKAALQPFARKLVHTLLRNAKQLSRR
jgi:hypothetical protein